MGGQLMAALRQLSPAQVAGQLLFYVLFCGFVGYLADRPEYRYLEEGQAEIKLAVRHAGQILGECRELSATAVQALAPNMRNPVVCPRERSPVRVALHVNDRALYERSIAPAGLHNDGISAAYETFRVAAGPVKLSVSVDDDEAHEGTTDRYEQDLVLRSGQTLVIEFNNGFRVHAPAGLL